MTQGERVNALRKELNLTLEKFGERIGLKKSAMSSIESGRNSLTEQTIISICDKNWNGKTVNEEWLRNGTGEMFKALDREEEIARMVEQLFFQESDSFKYRFIKALCNMDDKGWDVLENVIRDMTTKK